LDGVPMPETEVKFVRKAAGNDNANAAADSNSTAAAK